MSLNNSIQYYPAYHKFRSFIMNCGNPQYYTMYLKKSYLTSSAIQSLSVAMNVAYLENFSITMIIMRHPLNLGKLMIKSMLNFFYGLLDVNNDSNNPIGLWCLTLFFSIQNMSSHTSLPCPTFVFNNTSFLRVLSCTFILNDLHSLFHDTHWLSYSLSSFILVHTHDIL